MLFSCSVVSDCDPVDCSMPGLPVHHHLPELVETHVHRDSDAIQPSHPLSSPSPPAFNLSQRQGLFQRVSSLHEVAIIVERQLSPSSEYYLVRLMLKLKLQYFGHLMQITDIGNDPDAGKD